MEIHLVRHTTPDIAKGVCYGQTDIDLAASFHSEVKSVKDQLPDQFDKVFSSPLTRCSQLAKSISRETQIVFDDRLMEINFGDWELSKWDDIPKSELDPWMKDFVNIAPPGGESMKDLQNRVIDWWEGIDDREVDKILVITHAGVLRILWCHTQNIELKDSFNEFNVGYGQVLTVARTS